MSLREKQFKKMKNKSKLIFVKNELVSRTIYLQ